MSISTTDHTAPVEFVDGERPVYVPGVGLTGDCFVREGQIVRRVLGTGDEQPVLDAVPMPTVGETVVLGSGDAGVWLGVSHAPASGHLTVHVLDGTRVITRTAPPAAFDGRVVVVGTAPAEARAAHDTLAETLAAHAEQERSRADWLDTLVADLQDQANERGYCDVFDDFMADHDLPRREREYHVSLSVSASVSVTVTATSAEAAEEAITSKMIADALDEYDVNDWDASDTYAD